MQTPRSDQKLKWLSGQTGPLVLAERTSAAAWNDQHLTWARQHPEPVASLDVHRKCDALVLEGGFDTAWWPTPAQGGGMLVRMLWAPDEQDVMNALHQIPRSAWIEDGISFDAGSGALVLFDGSLDESRHQPIEIFCENIEFALSTANVEPDPQTCLVAHRLSPIH